MLDPFYYLEWLTEENFKTTIPELNLVNEEKDFKKILVIPFLPNFYENFLNLNLLFERFFKPPKQYFENFVYDLAIKYQLVQGDYYKLYSYMTNTKTSFFIDEEFLLLRNLLIQKCKETEYDEIVTISKEAINFQNLSFLKYKKLKKESIYGN